MERTVTFDIVLKGYWNNKIVCDFFVKLISFVKTVK